MFSVSLITRLVDTHCLTNSDRLFPPFHELDDIQKGIALDGFPEANRTIIDLLKKRAEVINSQQEGYSEHGWKVGDIIEFGRYMQDYLAHFRPTPIEWIVYGLYEGKALLVSRSVLLGEKQISEYFSGDTLYNCDIRRSLNHDFYQKAFTDEERKIICLTYNNVWEKCRFVPSGSVEFVVPSYPMYIRDSVFILSASEATKGDPRMVLSPMLDHVSITDFARSSLIGNTEWWLRTEAHGNDSNVGVCVHQNTFSCSFGEEKEPSSYITTKMKSESCGIRPALWIDISEYEKKANIFAEYNKFMEIDEDPDENEPEIDYYEDINDIARSSGFDIDDDGHWIPRPDW